MGKKKNKKSTQKTQRVGFTAPGLYIEFLDEMATVHGISRAETMRWAIYTLMELLYDLNTGHQVRDEEDRVKLYQFLTNPKFHELVLDVIETEEKKGNVVSETISREMIVRTVEK